MEFRRNTSIYSNLSSANQRIQGQLHRCVHRSQIASEIKRKLCTDNEEKNSTGT